MVASNLRYGILFWGNAYGVEEVLKSQKRCVRAICNLRRTDSCRPFFKSLGLLTVPSLYIYEVSVFVKRNLHRFSAVTSQRRCDTFKPVTCKTVLLQKSILAMAPKIYNRLPKCIRILEDTRIFKRKLQKLLTEKAYYSVLTFLEDRTLTKYDF